MRYLAATLFLASLSFSVLAQTKSGKSNGGDRRQSDISSQIRSTFDRYANEGFSGSVLIVSKGKTVFEESYGFANETRRDKNGIDTRFNVASISKIFTAAAILKLESDGKLKTTDLLSKYFGDMPAAKNTATIHHLLCHTGGLVRRGSGLNYSSRNSLINSVRSAPMESEPGKEFRYSNLGYSLLAAIVEIVSGVSYEQYLYDNILTPAGTLDIAHAWDQRLPQRNLATGYNDKGVALPGDADSWGDKGG